jgi:hypothetical protein
MSAYPQKPSFPIDVRGGRRIKVDRVGGTALQVDLEDAAFDNDVLAPMAAFTVKGNATGVEGPPQDVPLATLAALGNPLGDKIASKANAVDLGSAAGASIAQLAAPNLFTNSDFSVGDSAVMLCPNDALDVVNVRNWVMQQSTLTPFMSLKRTIAPGGGYAIRLTNGIPSGTTATITNTGTVTFSIPPDHNFRPGIEVTAAYALDPSILMLGKVAAVGVGSVTIAPTFVNGGGTYSDWAIGRPGATTKGQTKLLTTAAAAAGSYTLTFSDTSSIDIGANIESAGGGLGGTVNGIDKATYVVSKTSTTVTMSKPVRQPLGAPTGAGVVLNQQITFYGAQGIYAYQNIPASAAKDFKNGTPYARTSYFSFQCRSFYCQGTRASVMVLGYKSLFELGTSYAEAFDIGPQPTRVSVPILGDKVGAPNTWIAGYDALDGYPYMCVGPCWESNDTPTSRNIPVGQWRPDVFAVGGSDQQTLALSARVGSWVEFWDPKLEFDLPTSYRCDPVALPPVEEVRLRSPFNPLLLWEATRNAVNTRKFFAYLNTVGELALSSINDAENQTFVSMLLKRDGRVRLPTYPAGEAVFSADGTLASIPRQAAWLARQQVQSAGRLIAVGDSITEQGVSVSGSFISTNSYGELEVALTLARRINHESWINSGRTSGRDGGNLAVSGTNSDQLIASLDDALAMGGSEFLVAICANDVLQGFTLAKMQANLATILDHVFGSGVQSVILATVGPMDTNQLDPNTATHASYRKNRVDLNAWIRSTLSKRSGVKLYDRAKAYEDTARTTAVAGDYLPKVGTLRDGLHPNAFGAWTYGGPELASLFKRTRPDLRAYMPFGYDNILPAAPFVGNAGVLGTRVSGALPNGVSATMDTGSSTALAVLKSPSYDAYYGTGNQRIAFTINPIGTAAFERLVVAPTTSVAVGSLAGQYVRLWADIELQPWANWGNVSLFAVDQNGAPHMMANAPFDPATDKVPGGAGPLIYQTPPFMLPANGSVTTLTPILRITFLPAAGGGVSYVDLNAWWLGAIDDPRPIYNRI